MKLADPFRARQWRVAASSEWIYGGWECLHRDWSRWLFTFSNHFGACWATYSHSEKDIGNRTGHSALVASSLTQSKQCPGFDSRCCVARINVMCPAYRHSPQMLCIETLVFSFAPLQNCSGATHSCQSNCASWRLSCDGGLLCRCVAWILQLLAVGWVLCHSYGSQTWERSQPVPTSRF